MPRPPSSAWAGSAGPALAAERRGAAEASTPASARTACTTTADLVAGDNIFVAATGVTDGALLKGVTFSDGGAVTDSIVMRSRSGTVRRVEAFHDVASSQPSPAASTAWPLTTSVVPNWAGFGGPRSRIALG